MSATNFNTQRVFGTLKSTLHSYLEAQYHIWDDSLIRERHLLLESPGATHNEPFYEATPAYASLGGGYGSIAGISPEARSALIECTQVAKSPVFSKPFTHQARAIELFEGQAKELVIATGTGSGKTESFLLPLIASLAKEGRVRPGTASLPAMRALLLYPMNALVNDQLTRLRKLLGNVEISAILSKGRTRPIRFGMYTSRTPYPGARLKPAKDRARLQKKFAQYLNIPEDVRAKLISEGMWPAKDIQKFVENGFTTSNDDCELLTRHEMQAAPPDLLVTNYSMLEYMLMRPVERDIFERTKDWLSQDKDAFVTVILDEAHMYRGAAGAEVALLLRRLQSRLGVSRDRLKFILTSASMGEGKEAEKAAIQFAATLTGHTASEEPFELITGTQDFPPNDGVGSAAEARTLARFDRSLLSLSSIEENRLTVLAGLNKTLQELNLSSISGDSAQEIRDALFSSLWESPVVGRLARVVTGQPYPFKEVATKVFSSAENRDDALEALMSICNFSQRISDGRILLPVRMHTFFRGLGGLFACVNPICSHRLDGEPGPKMLGRLFDEPRLRCLCGSRVYELLTHRDCGAAYLKVFLKGADGDFLWHEPGYLETGPALTEAHLLVQMPQQIPHDAIECWLHLPTGRIQGNEPSQDKRAAFLRVFRPVKLVSVDKRDKLTFNGECPVCQQKWRKDTTKIMDLVTKGDAPFAHLIKAQVQTQPAIKKEDDVFPNGGRKSLLFSDGRQKAARLARDVPREIEKDVFRQLLIVGVAEAGIVGLGECRTNSQLYVAFIHVVSKFSLRMFDGPDRATLIDHVAQYRSLYKSKLRDALDEPWEPSPPPPYFVELLRQLGNRFYSLASLTIGYVLPAMSSMRRLSQALPTLSDAEVKSAAIHWLVHALSDMALDKSLSSTVRSEAFGRQLPESVWGLERQKDISDNKVLDKRLRGLEIIYGRPFAKNFDELMISMICELRGNAYFILSSRLTLVNALSHTWLRCNHCTWMAPFSLKDKCPECGHADPVALDPTDSNYLRARKMFWRDPVDLIVKGLERPFTIDVQEHTAQLGYIDEDDTSSTTEDYERCFRDILSRDGDTPVDVLSSTTTMEVGIDIGSLIAVGLRNVPPMRQNYQQRAGRAGRRGSAVSTVITYAQNGAHDSYYFKDPVEIIRGQPPVPSVDVGNPRIVTRHIHAALIQSYFHEKVVGIPESGSLFSTLGLVSEFYDDSSPFSLFDFKKWVGDAAGKKAIESIQHWIPFGTELDASKIAQGLIDRLTAIVPSEEEKERPLLDFLFEKGLFPTYAFPRSLCALQIEYLKSGEVEIEQRPQQALSIALSEYSPGREVVVNKKKYKIGAVTANGKGADRAAALFALAKAISYIHCPNCGYTQLPSTDTSANSKCPFCDAAKLSAVDVIQPEVVYPEGAREVNEFADEPVFSYATSAQYPAPTGPEEFSWRAFGKECHFVAAPNQTLVMVNKGIDTSEGFSGFQVCELCGRTPAPGELLIGPHTRHYLLPKYHPASRQCLGQARPVYLGYQFRSDLLLIRIPVQLPLLQSLETTGDRQALEISLISLAEALTLAAAHELDVDPRELGGGVRFIQTEKGPVADLFIHDTASGGAGYAHMAGEKLPNVIKNVRKLLVSCTCDSSCRKCLRHYGNRMLHGKLDRFLAIDILEYIETGKTPPIESAVDQSKTLEPLKEMLELAGYSCEKNGDIPLSIKVGSKILNIGVFPSILDEAHCNHSLLGKGNIYSEFSLQRNLPSVFSHVLGALE